MNKRIREIDFLRGLAVLLVVFFHYPSIPYLNKVGYIGVDLFFVLSGYLISSLLFKEYIKFGNVKSVHFLIRRGFKIYPLFYFFIALSIITKLCFHEAIKPLELFGELTFTRNFTGGFWAHTWTLCVEEHFYFFIAIAMLYIKRQNLYNVKKVNKAFLFIFIFSMAIELINAVAEGMAGTNYFLNDWARQVQTQYCFDSLLYGVFISYNLHFNKKQLEGIFRKHAQWLTSISILILLTIPGFRNSYFSPLKNALLYISFGNILLLFLTGLVSFSNIKNSAVKLIVNAFAKVGVYSYAVYLFHPFIRDYVIGKSAFLSQLKFSFLIYLILSIVSGVVFTKMIEFPMLALRERYFPARDKKLRQVPIVNHLGFRRRVVE